MIARNVTFVTSVHRNWDTVLLREKERKRERERERKREREKERKREREKGGSSSVWIS